MQVFTLFTEEAIPMMDLEGTRAFATFLLQTERGGDLMLAIAEGLHAGEAFLDVMDALAGLTFLFAAWVALVFLVVAVRTLEVLIGFLVLVLVGFLLGLMSWASCSR